MSTIAVIGGTGYAGRHIAQEAAARGHDVIVIARSEPADPVPGARFAAASILDADAVLAAAEGADAVVVAAAPRGDMAGRLRPAIAALAEALPAGVRLGVVGGAGGSLVAPGGPRLIDGDFPEDYKPEAFEMIGALEDLGAAPAAVDWFFVHPAAEFGAFHPGERTGAYRTGGDVMVTDAEGRSRLSGGDLAIAVLDEIERPAHRRARFTVGY